MAVQICYSEPAESFRAERLIGRHLSGDRWASDQLVEHTRRIVERRLRALGLAGETAYDATQESLLQILGKLDRYEPGRGTYAAWVGSFALNAARELRRRARRYVSGERAWDVSDTGDGVDSRAAFEGSASLREAIRSLPVDDRELLFFRFELGMTSKEIAVRRQMNDPQVRKRISRALEKLRRRLG
jgi:RNA polymerase sigma-70 factor (ECF subfamily)